MPNTNNQQRRFLNTRWLQIGVLAALAVALMVGAAFWFGTGLRADTTKSVAASPIGSSLTAVRESRLDDYYGRLSDSSAAAMAASAAASRLEDYYFRVNKPSAADQYQFEWMGFTAPESVENKPSTIDQYQNEWMGFTSPESVGAKLSLTPDPAADPYQNEWMGFTSPESVGTSSAAAASASIHRGP